LALTGPSHDRLGATFAPTRASCIVRIVIVDPVEERRRVLAGWHRK
jgi:hypothetical protein